MYGIWEFFVWSIWLYFVITCIWIFITVIFDVFRDPELNGWVKALWVIFLVALPFLGALIYLIARGRNMSQRRVAEAQAAQAETSAYIREVAVASPTSEIAKAKELLDAGAISQAEYDALKTKALA